MYHRNRLSQQRQCRLWVTPGKTWREHNAAGVHPEASVEADAPGRQPVPTKRGEPRSVPALVGAARAWRLSRSSPPQTLVLRAGARDRALPSRSHPLGAAVARSPILASDGAERDGHPLGEPERAATKALVAHPEIPACHRAIVGKTAPDDPHAIADAR